MQQFTADLVDQISNPDCGSIDRKFFGFAQFKFP
jgi:hypothetical protein